VVHCLAGENGSGKSTLLGMLSGQLTPDAGTIELDGRVLELSRPSDALRHGIAMVSQETALAPHLSVAENVLMGRRLVRSARGIDWSATRAKASQILERLSLDYDPRWIIEDLRPDQRQMVEIARALSMDARLVILDEPTSSLTSDEVEGLFKAIRHLKAIDVSTVFVSHRLAELFAICDEVTVLRDGRTVSTGVISNYTPEAIVAAMVGENVSSSVAFAARPTERVSGDEPAALRIRGMSAPGVLKSLDLEVGAGEIVGLAGLLGSGRSELLEVLFGLRAASSTELLLDGAPYAPRSPRAAIAKRIGYVPPDRKTQGLLLAMSVQANLAIVRTSTASRLRPPDRRIERRVVVESRVAMGIRAASHDIHAGTLSGGNQQKVAMGKWLAADPRLLLLDEPTRGVDVAAKRDIHVRLRQAASRGLSMLVSSSESDELLGLCDRILVMSRGELVADLAAASASESQLAALAGGHS
jgi:ABC-type sugar transport system ATPase subunit